MLERIWEPSHHLIAENPHHQQHQQQQHVKFYLPKRSQYGKEASQS